METSKINAIAFMSPASMSPWVGRYAKLVAIVLLYGAMVHISNIAGFTGTPWLSTPLLWRCMDIALLIFNITAAVALWRELFWSVWFVFGGLVLLQFVPYVFLRSHFILKPDDAQTLNGLLGMETILLAIFFVLLWMKK